jgi:CRISPR system Cascade subunit CasC
VARESAQKIAGCFGKMKSGDDALEIEHLAHINPEEITQIEQLIEKIAKSGKAPSDEELNILTKNRTAVDIAMFGRMLAASPKFNTEAAVQVAHAITVHEIAVEDDYFTAVDDLNRGEEDSGAGHLGETEFAAGLFYLYVCINKDLLIANLGGKEELAKTSLKAFIEAATKIAPTGKQNSFASRAYASYLLAEKGAQQPRSLSVAFLKPVEGKDMLKDAIDALRKCRENIDTVYGKCCASDCEMNTITGQKTLEEILMFVAD